MIRELIYLTILFLVGFFVLQVFYSFYSSAGKIIAREVENITNTNYASPGSYIINEENFNDYSILYLIQNQQKNVCINKIEINNIPANFSYKVINQYTLELNVSENVNAGSNITIEYCNGQSYNYIIT
ncbi:MAG: hypothetical protein ACP5GJ_01430 [Nanopusillaceae archaeon]|jgi:hypothetical protein